MNRSTFPKAYRIVVRGQLNEYWAHWFSGLSIRTTASGDTELSGKIQDQAALYGILNRLRDLGLTLVLVTQLEEPIKNENQNNTKKGKAS